MNDLLKDDQFCKESTKLMYDYWDYMDRCYTGILSNRMSFEYYYKVSQEKEEEVCSFLKDRNISDGAIDFIVGEAKGDFGALQTLYSNIPEKDKEIVRFLRIGCVKGRYEKEKKDEFISRHKDDLIDYLKKFKSAAKDIDVFCSGDLSDEKYWRTFIEAKDTAFDEMKVMGFNNPTIRKIFEGLGGSYDYDEDPEEEADDNMAKMFIKAVKKNQVI